MLDPSGLPDPARKLLGLLPDRLPTPAPAPRRTFQPLALTGAWTIGILAELGELSAILAFVGAVQLRKFAADDYVANLERDDLMLIRSCAARL